MGAALKQFEEIYQLFNEASGNYPPASGAIAATSDPARKDFGAVGGNGYPPSTSKKGIQDPYQSHPDATMSDPTRIPHMPFPMETVNDFLADSCVYLMAALKQMKMATQNNPSLDPVFKKEINNLRNKGENALKVIQEIGKRLEIPANLNY